MDTETLYSCPVCGGFRASSTCTFCKAKVLTTFEDVTRILKEAEGSRCRACRRFAQGRPTSGICVPCQITHKNVMVALGARPYVTDGLSDRMRASIPDGTFYDPDGTFYGQAT